MKKGMLLAAAMLMLGAAPLFMTQAGAAAAETPLVSVQHDGVRYSESVLPYDGGIFVSNVGADAYVPRPDENKGYVFYEKNGQQKMIIPPTGVLHQPTAMLVKDHFLFVCDGEALKVFDLQDTARPPQVIHFASDDKVVNDLAAGGDTLYITLTNTGRIYTLDISQPAQLSKVKPKLWLNLPGPNGIVIGQKAIYVASIPPDYVHVQPENVIYRIRNQQHPVAEKLVNVPGLYDGVALSDDEKTLYISDWKTAAVTAVDTATGKQKQVLYQEKGIGPADIAQAGSTLYIPDIVNSRIIEMQVK